MESIYALPFTVLEIPQFKIRKPSWVKKPSAMVVFNIVLFSYFLVTGGIVYDIVNEPPSIGSTIDEHGHTKPVAFMPHRVNGQYIMEGLAASFLFTIGGFGYMMMDRCSSMDNSTPKLNKLLLTTVSFLCIIVSYIACIIFMRKKLPSYLRR